MKQLTFIVAFSLTACIAEPQPDESQIRWADAGTTTHGSAGPSAAQGTLTGTVAETMNSGGYTYVRIDQGETSTWAAGPETQVEVGDTVTTAQGSAMRGYHSKTLERTFDVVYFVPSIAVGDTNADAPMPAGHPNVDALPADHPPTHTASPAAADADLANIAPAPGGTTVAQLFADKADLGGARVKIRGRVVKYNGGILGRNWLHLRDGTGDAGTNDITVTSNDPAALGDLVVVEGVVGLNKDFGAGYAYDVIVEDASVTVE